jgi:peptidylprolyl isomerase
MAEDAPAKPPMEEGFVDISVEQNGGLLKKILVEGTGDDTPKSGSDVSVHYVGTLNADGSKFDSSRDRPGTFDFDVGNGRVIRGWDVGILTMKKNEKAILRCSSEYGYGDRGSPPKIPGGAVLDFEVELFSWKIPPKSMSAEERSQKAAAQKDLGNAAFKEQKWEAAVEAYELGVEYVMFSHEGGGGGPGGDYSDDEDEEMKDDSPPTSITDEDKVLAVALLSNCAMAKLKVNDPEGAVSDCSRAISLDGDNVKAVFRRGQGHLALGNTAEATADASRVLELDPANTQAVQLKRSALEQVKKAKQKEKELAAKMFGGK